MKKWIWVLLLLLPLGAAAQQAPDNEQIDLAIHDYSSPFYYPKLMDRYQQGDETLTTEDYRYLYYGYMFQGDYNPHSTVLESDSVVMILLREPDLTADDYRRLIKHGNTILKTEPFNPRILNILTYAYGTVGDTANEELFARRFTKVMDAILSSGEGDKESSPWHILYYTHAEDVMDQFGLQYLKPMVVSRTAEYFPLVKRQGRTRGYYFDFSRIFTRRPDEPAQPKERRWQINDRVLN